MTTFILTWSHFNLLQWYFSLSEVSVYVHFCQQPNTFWSSNYVHVTFIYTTSYQITSNLTVPKSQGNVSFSFLFTFSLLIRTLSLSLGVCRARIIRGPAEFSTLHLTSVCWLHDYRGKPLGQLWIPFMGIWEDLFKVYVRLKRGLHICGDEKVTVGTTCERTIMR